MKTPNGFHYINRSKYERKQCRRQGLKNLIQKTEWFEPDFGKDQPNHPYPTLVQNNYSSQSIAGSIIFDFLNASLFLCWIAGSSQNIIMKCLFESKTPTSNYNNFKSWIVLLLFCNTYLLVSLHLCFCLYIIVIYDPLYLLSWRLLSYMT